MKKQLLISFLIILFLITGTVLVVLHGKGYRFGFEKGKPDLSGTGLLVATSSPNGAQVFVNGHLTTATDNTISLSPGDYTIKIFKEGYFPWEKKIKIQKEIVSKAEALLFPTYPKLESITAREVKSPVIDPSMTKVAYTSGSQSIKKNGIFVLDMSSKPILTLQSASTQIADDTADKFSDAKLSWSPDGKDLIATISGELRSPTTYLLSASGSNDSPKDVTATLDSVDASWKNDKEEKEKAQLETLKTDLRKVISQNFRIISWSPDETKLLYEASQSATIPLIIKPRLIGTDSTPEVRVLEKDSIYVYDIREDKNFKINIENWNLPDNKGNFQKPKPLSWFPDSKHLVYVHDNEINIMEYDGLNLTKIYAGQFTDNYVFSWPNGSKIVILTNLNNPSISPNLYTIGLK
ncbi:MAG: PEGA domain-containing protein [Candidatus Levybacteria bacterium]|nr:PEGA domain-containing protein [Candidatus Levybacteria bacterium]